MEKIYIVSIAFSLFLTSCTPSLKQDSQDNLPRSKQATFIETFSPAEVAIRATGLGRNNSEAEIDARKSALYFVLFGGTDPILQNIEERQSFQRIQNDFFQINNVVRYITFEGKDYLSRVRTVDGDIRIEKMLRIHKERLIEDLAFGGIVTPRDDIADIVGNPFIMVIPATERNVEPIDLLRQDPLLRHAANVIESFLTAHKYDVVVPEQKEILSELAELHIGLAGDREDYQYSLALSIGSDIYITFAVSEETRRIGRTTVRKATASVRAYETTTGRLLGTETGYSPERSAASKAVVEEALNDAIDKVLSRISAYWKDDIRRGVQYKLIFRISDRFDNITMRDIPIYVAEALGNFAQNKRENIVTDRTIDYRVWVSAQKFSSPTAFFTAIRGELARIDPALQVYRITANRKMLIVGIEPPY